MTTAPKCNNLFLVQGTVIESHYRSENGAEPVGEIKITKYSTDPKDLGDADGLLESSKGLTSVTTTQKFGYKGVPSFGTLVDKKKCEDEVRTNKTASTTKVARRGSVKALSQKFINNAGKFQNCV